MPFYNWKYNGTLEENMSDFQSGVYLLIFKSNPKRIVYVGTSNCFKRRMIQHKTGYMEGNRTIWRVSKGDDIYELMSYQGAGGKASKFKYYASLAKRGLLWAHTTLEKEEIINDLNKKDNFKNNWQEYVTNFYIKNIEIWTCSMSDDEDRILALESKIQRTFQNNFFIGSHINANGMSFLGKIEFTGDLSNFEYNFLSFPDLDKKSIMLLTELPDKKVIDFKKKSYCLKQELKLREIQEARIKHQFAYTKWDNKENDILYSCCKLGIEVEIIAHEYLQRTIEEVKNRINYLSKFYDFNNNT